jgi:hypothetical protein
MMSNRRKGAGTTTVLPPPPAIPEPSKTEAEITKERHQKAEISRLIREIRANQIEQNLERALCLVQMAQRGQGPLIEYFTDLGFKYRKLADEGPERPRLRVIEGGQRHEHPSEGSAQ